MKRYLITRALRKIYTFFFKPPTICNSFVEYRDQEANDLVRERIIHSEENGLLVAKFGTYELSCVNFFSRDKIRIADKIEMIKGTTELRKECIIPPLCSNAGFFPQDENLIRQFSELMLQDCSQIDILGSYIYEEKYRENELKDAIKVNLNGYYAPFLWKNPWSSALKDKRVLVIHPFTESIKMQYAKRELLFTDKSVLPAFKSLETIRAVQTIAGNTPDKEFNNWFDALYYMENEIDKKEFDIALIGCGAYGLPLAAYIKRKGKIAIHLAGWTQMLFGIYGNRWIHDQPEFSRFINEYWIRPSMDECPHNKDSIENGCYW